MSKNSETSYPLFCHSQELLLDSLGNKRRQFIMLLQKLMQLLGCPKVRICFIKLLFLIVSLLINTQFCCNEVVVIASGTTKKRRQSATMRLFFDFQQSLDPLKPCNISIPILMVIILLKAVRYQAWARH